MIEIKTNWTKQKLQSYLLVYCIHADYKKTDEEVEYVKSKISDSVYNEVTAEFEKDNDITRIKKIQSAYSKLNYSNDEKGELISEIKTLFLSDGKFDTLERNLFMCLKRILN